VELERLTIRPQNAAHEQPKPSPGDDLREPLDLGGHPLALSREQLRVARELPRDLVDELAAHGHHHELASSSSSRAPHVSRRSVASVRFAGTLPRMRAHVCARSATAIWYAFGCWSRLQSLTTTSQIGQSSQPATPSNSSPSSTRSG